MRKKVVALLLAGILSVPNLNFGGWSVEAKTVNDMEQEFEGQANRNQMEQEQTDDSATSMEKIENAVVLDDLPEEEQGIISDAVSVAEDSGEAAGEILNELEENSEAVDLGVKEVLDTYYSSESVDEVAIGEFSASLDKNIEECIENYEEAREERENQDELDYIAGEQIITFDKNTSKEDIDAIVSYVSDSYEIVLDNEFELDTSLSKRKQKRLKALENYKGNIVVKAKLDLDQTVAGAGAEFEEFDCVIAAEADEKCGTEGLTSELNDTYAGSQWYLDRCNFLDAWDSVSTAGCDDIWIAVIDSGCRMSHKDLAGGLVSKYAVDVTQKDSDGKYKKLADLKMPYDTDHGTECAGVIAAKAKNSIGIAGAARGWKNNSCRVIPIKMSSGFNQNGELILNTYHMLLAIKHAVDSGAEVISISISGTGLTEYEKEAIAYAEKAGVIVVSSAGNKKTSQKRYPAAIDYVISVGGTDSSKTNEKASFSSYGNWVDIVAPATSYVTTTARSDTQYIKGIEGTSFSTPLVASAIGLMLSVNPDLSVSQIKNILNSTATDIKSSYFDCGMLNAGLAVQKAKYQEFKNSTVTLTSAKALSNKKIKLQWNDLNVYGPEKVLIYRATSKDGTYSKIKTLSGNDILSDTYTDTGLTSGKTYYYKIRVSMKYGSGNKYTPYSSIKAAKAVN